MWVPAWICRRSALAYYSCDYAVSAGDCILQKCLCNTLKVNLPLICVVLVAYIVCCCQERNLRSIIALKETLIHYTSELLLPAVDAAKSQPPVENICAFLMKLTP